METKSSTAAGNVPLHGAVYPAGLIRMIQTDNVWNKFLMLHFSIARLFRNIVNVL